MFRTRAAAPDFPPTAGAALHERIAAHLPIALGPMQVAFAVTSREVEPGVAIARSRIAVLWVTPSGPRWLFSVRLPHDRIVELYDPELDRLINGAGMTQLDAR